MKRSSLVLALLWLVLAIPAQAEVNCTATGTPSRDEINGDDGHDAICLKGGRDYGNGRGAADIVKGARGSDTLVGGTGPDEIRGGDGDDELFAVDGVRDLLNGGRGFDNCYGDDEDTFVSCNHIVRVS